MTPAKEDNKRKPRVNAGGLRIIEIYDTDDITLAEVNDMILAAEEAITRNVEIKLLANQFSAIVSLICCIGPEEFLESKLLAALNDCFDDLSAVPACAPLFKEYIYAENKKGEQKISSKLVSRRNEEIALFLAPSLEVNKPLRPKRK